MTAYQIASARLYTAASVLENYGKHHEWCDRPSPCSCGFDQELDRLRSIATAWASRGVGAPTVPTATAEPTRENDHAGA